MTNVNITNFRKDIYELLEQTIKYNEPLNISTKNGNAIVLSEEDYNNLMETLYRLVYQVFEDIKVIKIISIWSHYENIKGDFTV